MLVVESRNETIDICEFLNLELPDHIDEVLTKEKCNGSRKQVFSDQTEEQDSFRDQFLDLRQKLYLDDIHCLLPERAPGLKITKSVICEVANELIIIAPFPITEETCAGHMPGFPFLPLAEAGRILAQAGAILVGYSAKAIENKSGLITPLVYKVGEVLSGQQGYLRPGNTVCIIAKARKLKGPLYAVQAHGYLNQKHIFSMPKIHYFLSEDAQLWGNLKEV